MTHEQFVAHLDTLRYFGITQDVYDKCVQASAEKRYVESQRLYKVGDVLKVHGTDTVATVIEVDDGICDYPYRLDDGRFYMQHMLEPYTP